MGPETKGKRLLLNSLAKDRGRRTMCPRGPLARSRSSPLCGELCLRAWSSVRYREDFCAGTVAQVRTEKIHRRNQDRPARMRFFRKVAQDRGARGATLNPVGSPRKLSASQRASTHEYFWSRRSKCKISPSMKPLVVGTVLFSIAVLAAAQNPSP